MVNIEDTVDAQRLYNQSPDKHWKNISGPVFMSAGERDDRVAIEHIRDMALRLESAGRKVALLSDPKEGHSPVGKLAREAYFYMLENALAAYLKGRADQHKSPNLERYINKYLTINTTPMNAELTR